MLFQHAQFTWKCYKYVRIKSKDSFEAAMVLEDDDDYWVDHLTSLFLNFLSF